MGPRSVQWHVLVSVWRLLTCCIFFQADDVDDYASDEERFLAEMEEEKFMEEQRQFLEEVMQALLQIILNGP